jgi:branched-chain amino acid transport system substrate-binding protein
MAQDALLLLVNAMKTSKSLDGEALAKAMESTKGLKVTSGVLTIDPKTHDPLDKPAVIQKVDAKAKAFVFVKKFDPRQR